MTECLFCQIVSRELPAEIVYENDRAVAFRDINPQAPFHLLLVPKSHIESLDQAAATEGDLLKDLLSAAATVGAEQDTAGYGYRLAINNGRQQAMPHLHIHVLGGAARLGLVGEVSDS